MQELHFGNAKFELVPTDRKPNSSLSSFLLEMVCGSRSTSSPLIPHLKPRLFQAGFFVSKTKKREAFLPWDIN